MSECTKSEKYKNLWACISIILALIVILGSSLIVGVCSSNNLLKVFCLAIFIVSIIFLSEQAADYDSKYKECDEDLSVGQIILLVIMVPILLCLSIGLIYGIIIKSGI